MEFLDARRLTGPNLLWRRPGAILDIRCGADEVQIVLECWQRHVRRILDAVGWEAESTCHRRFSGGISLALSAPIDALYSATALTEWAWACCDAELNNAAMPDFTDRLAGIRAEIGAERNPALLDLQRAAAEHGIAFLWDDDQVSLGLGRGSATWSMDRLPAPAALDWSRFRDVPAALITGTNGKTTTARLAAHILRIAGSRCGLTSTEWIAVNERIVERGDWSGPGGARRVLREPDVDVAILETARGGLLRRGLGLDRARAALITNVAEDHLGDFGSQNLQELLDIKWIVSLAVEPRGALILNADDPLLVAKSAEYGGRVDWFTLDADNPVVAAHVAGGGRAFLLSRGGDLLLAEGTRVEHICAAADVPIVMGGTARHNIANALAAAAVASELGVATEQIRDGLETMVQDDNPGRSNLFEVQDFRVLVDFAHNPHAMQALFDMARAVPARRRLLCFGQAGDRTDTQIRELARRAWSIGLDAVIVSELTAYARGRSQGEVYSIIRDELLRVGAEAAQILYFPTEAETFERALQWAGPGDLVIMLALGGSAPVRARLQELMQ